MCLRHRGLDRGSQRGRRDRRGRSAREARPDQDSKELHTAPSIVPAAGTFSIATASLVTVVDQILTKRERARHAGRGTPPRVKKHPPPAARPAYVGSRAGLRVGAVTIESQARIISVTARYSMRSAGSPRSAVRAFEKGRPTGCHRALTLHFRSGLGDTCLVE